MSLITSILATWKGPAPVVRRLLSDGPREDRALALCMGFCVTAFVARWPALAREAHVEDLELDMLLGGALLGVVFILPLFLYLLAGVSHAVARALGGQGTWYGARVALFWGGVASTPLLLFAGLVAGFIGEGPLYMAVGAAWFAVFCWFWIGGLLAAERAEETPA